MKSGGSGAVSLILFICFCSATPAYAQLHDASGQASYVTGSFGVGTTNPGGPLEVNGNALIDGFAYYRSSYSGIGIRSSPATADADITMDGNKNLVLDNPSSNALLVLSTGGSGRLDINQSGYVGIGTAWPNVSLQIDGTAVGYAGNMVIQDSSHASTNSSASAAFSGVGNDWVPGSVTGVIWSLGMGGLGSDAYYINHINAGIQFWTNNAEHMYLNSSGNLIVYGSGTTCTIGSGTGATNCTSDERLKQDIAPIPDALAKLAQIRGVTFRWKDPKKSADEHIGVIAQDVEKVFPQAVGEVNNKEFGKVKTVDIAALVAPLIEAVKELQADNDALRARIEALEAAR